jgi:general nucleoside transport system permease protein
MRLRLEARGASSQAMVYLSPVIAVAASLVAGGLLFLILGRDPLVALYTLFIRPVGTIYGVTELLLKATPLLLCAIGLAVGFRANVWNIGAEGQFTMGAICGGGLALLMHGEESWWLLPAMLVAGILGGLLWGAIPAFLKTRFHAHEILTSLMLSYVAIQLLGYLVHGPWRDPLGYNFPQTKQFGDAALLPILVEGTRLHAGVIAAALVVPLATLLLGRTVIGFEVKVIGLAPAAGRYAGFREDRIVWFTLLLGGGLAGLAGIFEAAGPIGQLQPVVSPGYGFAAIIVAFLGRLHPVGILLASLLMALLYLGGEALQMSLNLPQAVAGVIQGMLLFFLLAADVFILYRPRLVAAPRPAPQHA